MWLFSSLFVKNLIRTMKQTNISGRRLLLALLLCISLATVAQEQYWDGEIFSPKQELTLLFAGDLMQHQAQIDAARTAEGYDYSDCFLRVKDEITSADLAIGNLEVTLAGKPYRGYPQFSAPDSYLEAIKDAGFDILLTANNHCLDRRKKGLVRTIAMLDSLNIPYAGTYINQEERELRYPLLVEKNGFRIVLLNYTYGTNGIPVDTPNVVNYIHRETMERDIAKAKSMQPDALIACIHWGIEYRSLPEKTDRELASWLLEKGVDHIIGSHPHVVQPMEVVTDSVGARHLVVYSLGNYLSNMSKRATDGGLMVKLKLEKACDKVRLADCAYSMVWVSRPVISGKKNFRIYPAGIPTDSLNSVEKSKLNLFLQDSRKLFNTYNKGIEEYIFK